jgi:hypothetical protein
MKQLVQIPKLSVQTVKLINQLPDKTRAQVDKIVKTHIAICMRYGSPVESLDRLFIEAVEIARLEANVPEMRTDFTHGGYEPTRHYDQYISPRDL